MSPNTALPAPALPTAARTPGSHWRRLGVLSCLLSLSACAGLRPPVAAVADDRCTEVPIARSTRIHAVAFDSGLPTAGQWRDGFVLQDMNGDGQLDLVHGPTREGDGMPAIFLGDGLGHYARWSQARFPPVAQDYGNVASADFNQDGLPDLALAVHLRGMATYLNEGGNFAPWGEGLTLLSPGLRANPGAYSSREIATVDWNGDGLPDLASVNEGPAMYAPDAASTDAFVLHLNRAGYWERVNGEQTTQGFGSALAVGDVDGDGRPDAMLGLDIAGNRKLLQINTGQSFRSRELQSLPADAATTAVALQPRGRPGMQIVAASRGNLGGQMCVALQTIELDADQEQSRWLWREPGRVAVEALVSADLNRDGRADLIAARSDGSMLSFLGTRTGYVRDVDLPAPAAYAGCTLYHAAVVALGPDQQQLLVSYAGEPDTFQPDRCPTQGGFAAWTLRVR